MKSFDVNLFCHSEPQSDGFASFTMNRNHSSRPISLTELEFLPQSEAFFLEPSQKCRVFIRHAHNSIGSITHARQRNRLAGRYLAGKVRNRVAMRIMGRMTEHFVHSGQQSIRYNMLEDFRLFVNLGPVELHDLRKKQLYQPMPPNHLESLRLARLEQTKPTTRSVINQPSLMEMAHHDRDRSWSDLQLAGNLAHGYHAAPTLFPKMKDSFEVVFNGAGGHNRKSLP
jgi:hypothetical protein